MFSRLRTFFFSMAILTLGGCSSTPKISSLEPLPKDLPADLAARFEVLESGHPAVKPSPSPAPRPTSKKEKRKKGVVVAPVPPPAPVFTYPVRRGKPGPIWVGEKQTLEITYIGLAAGEFTTEVLPNKVIGDRSVYHFRGQADTSSVMNLFYRLNDTIESFWDFEGLFSHRFHLVLDETKQKRDALELFDSEAKKDFYWDRKNHVEKGISESKTTTDIPSFPQDSYSALYYIRTLPLEQGKNYTFPVVSEGKAWDCVVTVARKDMMDSPLGRKSTIVLKIETRFNGVLKQDGSEQYIWLTDDDRRFIVRVEAKVKVGAVAARLKKVELGVKPSE